jgi:hypothetical protein
MLFSIVLCTVWIVVADGAVQMYVTALHRASAGGHVECVRLLLDRGARLDVVSVSSWLYIHRHRVAWCFARCAASACGWLCVYSGV